MNSIFISFIQYKMIWDSLGFKNNDFRLFDLSSDIRRHGSFITLETTQKLLRDQPM